MATRMGEVDELAVTLATIVVEGGPSAPQRICEACVAALPVSGAAITVMAAADRQEPICATDEVAGRLDELQFSLGEGPCVDAFTHRRPVLVADLAIATDHRWPAFAAAARQTPARAVYVFPLQVGAIAVGVLDLYHDLPGLPGTTTLSGALRTADAALWALLGLRAGENSDRFGTENRADPHGWLSGAPLARIEVYQATGMIIGQLDVTAETALARLRAHAYATGRPIDEVARDVIERRLRFDEEMQ
jgi:ANTAR domain